MSTKEKELSSKEIKDFENLKSELNRVFGSGLKLEGTLRNVAFSFNEFYDYLLFENKQIEGEVKPSVALKFGKSKDPEIRAMTARLLPAKFAIKMALDSDAGVRHAVAQKMPVRVLEQLTTKYQDDEHLRLILEDKKEKNSSYWKDVKELDDVSNKDVPELSDSWYRTKAFNIYQDYGAHQNLDTFWINGAVANFCKHNKSTNGVEIDHQKLLDGVKELVQDKSQNYEDREEAYSVNLSETVDWLLKKTDVESCESFEDDQTQDFLTENLYPSDYLNKFDEIFSVHFAKLPRQIIRESNYLFENFEKSQKVPVRAFLPQGLRRAEELALDKYVKIWNNKQKFNDNPVRLSWEADCDNPSTIIFVAETK